jgi:hypothetical protein
MSKTKFFPVWSTFLFLFLNLAFPLGPDLLAAPADNHREVGGASAPSPDDPSFIQDLEILDSQLEVSFQYTRFTGQDMRDTYGGIPVVAAGYSCRMAPKTRLFMSLGYGEAQGDPYYDTPGINGPDFLKIRYVPFWLGVKTDLAKSTRVHVYAGVALEVAWMEESGQVLDAAATGINTGYQAFFGPQFVLGPRGHALGLEVGYGGSKGEVTAKGHSHDIDLTGFRGRLFLALDL